MPKNIFLQGGTLIDGNGGDVIENAGVLISGDRITAVGPVDTVAVPPETEFIDVSGNTIMPGLIDAHMHFFGPKRLDFTQMALEPVEVRMGRALRDLSKLINAGFTSVRDCGSPTAVYIKRLMAEGVYKGPRIKTSHHQLSQTGGHFDNHDLPLELNQFQTCDGVAECTKRAREQLREGADFIKICSTGGVFSANDDPNWPQFTMDEIKAIVYEAEAVGSYVASHAQGAQGIKNALTAGVKTIEHGIFIDDEGIEMMLNQSAILVPTLTVLHQVLTNPDGIPDYALEKAKRVDEIHKANIRKAFKAGVKIALGTDCAGCEPMDHGFNALELEFFVRDIGMSPMEAIVVGTKGSAEALNIEESVGTIEKGKLADILVVEGNPLDDIRILTNTKNIKKVFVGGELLKGDEIY